MDKIYQYMKAWESNPFPINSIKEFELEAIVDNILDFICKSNIEPPGEFCSDHLRRDYSRPYMDNMMTYSYLKTSDKLIKHGYDISFNIKTNKVTYVQGNRNGKPNGLYAFADDQGKLKKIGAIVDDKYQGVELSWDEDLLPVSRIIYDKGNIINKESYCKLLCCYQEEIGLCLNSSRSFLSGPRIIPLVKTPYCLKRLSIDTGLDYESIWSLKLPPAKTLRLPGILIDDILPFFPNYTPIHQKE